MTDTELPANVRGFNEVATVILARLYIVFPEPINLDVDEVAKKLGLESR